MSAMVKASGLVKPYWIHVGSGGLPIRDERDVVDFFFDRDELDVLEASSKCGKGKGRFSKRDLELVTTNKFMTSRCPPPYWTEASLAAIERAGGLLLIPGDWPEPRAGRIWEHMVPFKPQITPCDAGKAEAKTSYVYVVQPGESPGDVAVRFGQPYEGWVKLRQANHDDPDGFTKPSSDAGACTFAKWQPGKRVKIPADWADPPKSDPVWKHVETHVLVSDPSRGVLAAPSAKDNSMHTRPYILQKGDTPGTLAGRHGVDKEQIFKANPQVRVVKDTGGERNPHPPDWRPGQRINMPVTAAGVLAGPRGQGEPTFTFNTMPIPSSNKVSRSKNTPGPTFTLSTPATSGVVPGATTGAPKWTDKPKTPTQYGSYLLFWAYRMRQQLGNVRLENYMYAISPLAKRLQTDPETIGLIQQWLQDAYANPGAFCLSNVNAPGVSFNVDAVPYITWNSEYAHIIASNACYRFLSWYCSLRGMSYDKYTGECGAGAPPSGQMGSCGSCGSGGSVGYYTLMPCKACGSLSGNCGCGGVGAPTVQRRAVRPVQAARPTVRSVQVSQPNYSSSWARKHPNWNGSYLAYWSMRVAAYVKNACGPVNYGSINAWLQSIPSPEAMVQKYGWVVAGNTPVYTPPGMWFDGPNDHVVAFRAAQAYCVGQGNVQGPPGQVGCGKGSVSSGAYGMDQFGGVAGFNRLVARATPQAQMQVKRVMPKIQSPWDQKHPNWNGSYLAYWSLRIEKIIEWNSFYESTKDLFYPCLYAIRYGNGRSQILAWLRTFSTPQAFENAMYAMYKASGPMMTFAPPDLWFARPQDKHIAATAARRVLTYCAGPTASGGVGAPSGTVGAEGDSCTPYGAAITDVKPYYYVVQPDDISNVWLIPTKFNMPTMIGSTYTWHQLRNANLDWVGGFATNNKACNFAGLYPGAKLKVPGNWLEPKPGTVTVPIGGTSQTCGAGQIEMGGQCVNLPPGVTVPVGGACPTGTTNVGGLCIPNNGYTPVPGQGCLPGTKLNADTGMCEIPGGTPSVVVPGIPPVNGKCPTGMTKHSDGLCYAPGTAPPGVTPVGLTTTTGSKADEGYPAWAWALLGLGTVAAVGGVAYYVKKQKDDNVEEEVEEEVVET